ncbi:hypothetical protein, partial [Dyadobacter sediminis]
QHNKDVTQHPSGLLQGSQVACLFLYRIKLVESRCFTNAFLLLARVRDSFPNMPEPKQHSNVY